MKSTPTTSPEMEFKEKKIREFDEKFRLIDFCNCGSNNSEYAQYTKDDIKDFLSSTIDEILSCVPEEKDESFINFNQKENIGHNSCLQQFYENMKKKLNI